MGTVWYDHAFQVIQEQSVIHCNGNPPAHGTCHVEYMVGTCWSHGPYIPGGGGSFARVDAAVRSGDVMQLLAMLEKREFGLEVVAGGFQMRSTCNAEVVAAFPMAEAHERIALAAELKRLGVRSSVRLASLTNPLAGKWGPAFPMT